MWYDAGARWWLYSWSKEWSWNHVLSSCGNATFRRGGINGFLYFDYVFSVEFINGKNTDNVEIDCNICQTVVSSSNCDKMDLFPVNTSTSSVCT